jgi:hypothetical protein
VEELREGGAKQKTRGALAGVKESMKEVTSSGRGDDDGHGEQQEREPARPRKAAARGRRPARRASGDEES